MSEAVIESVRTPRRDTDDARPVPIEDYSAATLTALAEEQHATDDAEQALEALLASWLLSGEATPGVPGSSTAAGGLAPGVVLSALKPILVPAAFAVAMSLFSRSSRSADPSDWHDLVEDEVNRAARRLLRAINQKPQAAARDIYSRQSDGPTDIDRWAQGVSRTIVTGLGERLKARLRQRLGFTHKRWLTRLDTRVRHSHRMLEGVTVPATEKFSLRQGEVLMNGPLDTSAPMEEWAGCRCKLLWIFKGTGA